MTTGFILDAMVICVADIVIRQLHRNNRNQKTNSVTSAIDFECETTLVLAITIHNIPEELAIGVASV